MIATKALVDYVTGTGFDGFPPETVQKVKLLILDAIGCGLGGTKTVLGQIFIDIAMNLVGNSQSTIIGSNLITNCTMAAFTNAELINALDYSDTGPIGHPGSTIIPAAIAVAETIGASGRDTLEAIVLGYEVCCRVALAITPSFERYLQVQGIGTPQVFGSVTAAGKLIGLKPDAMLYAFGIAGSYAPIRDGGKFGIYEEYPYKRAHQPHAISWIKDNVGRASEAGVLSALLADKGFLATTSILDGRTGFWAMAGSDRCDFDMMTKSLGEKFLIMEVGFKPYPACRYCGTTLDALTEILNKEKINPEDIVKIEVSTVKVIADSFVDYSPINMIDAEFSIQYPAAMIVYGVPKSQWYLNENLKNPKYLEMAKKVEVIFDIEAERKYMTKASSSFMPSRVQIIMKEGKKYDNKANVPKGSQLNPLEVEKIEEKFFDLANTAFESKKSTKIIQVIKDLEHLDEISKLTRLLRV